MPNTFDDKYQRVPESGCWIWTAAAQKRTGYGLYRYGGKSELAHRASYMIHKGQIAKGFCVLHRCDVTSCVNPDHLFLGTQLENIADRHAKDRDNHPVGEKNGRAKLNVEQVRKIRTDKRGCYEIAKEYGIGATAVRAIINRKAWKHA